MQASLVVNLGGDNLSTIVLLVLYESGGDNTLGSAYGSVQLHCVFDPEWIGITDSAPLRLFDLGLVRFVEASEDALRIDGEDTWDGRERPRVPNIPGLGGRSRNREGRCSSCIGTSIPVSRPGRSRRRGPLATPGR